MAIKAKVTDDMKSALKAGDKDRLSFARNLLAAIRKREIDDREDLDDSEITKLIQTAVKQRQESIEQFTKGGRQDLVDRETAELAYLKTMLPAQLSPSEVREIITATLKELGLSGPASLGKAMQAVLPKLQGQADGKLVNQIVREVLGS